MEHPRPLVNAVYYPSWSAYRGIPPSSLTVAKISTVFYAFVIPNEDGTLKFLDEHADVRIPVDGVSGCLAALACLKQANPHLRAVLSIGGGTGSAAFSTLAATPAGREIFARSAREWVDRYSFDGLDVDWEHPATPAQGSCYLKLLQACRNWLPAPRYLLATALPADPGVLCLIHLPSLTPIIDHLNLMCYDFSGPWNSLAGHHAQLFSPVGHPPLSVSGQAGVHYLVSHGMSPQRILLGIPVYARVFPGAQGPGSSFRCDDGESLELDYRCMPSVWREQACVDRQLGAAWFVDKDRGFVSFDVPETVRIKAGFARSADLGGIFFWSGAGDASGENSLVAAGFDALHSNAID